MVPWWFNFDPYPSTHLGMCARRGKHPRMVLFHLASFATQVTRAPSLKKHSHAQWPSGALCLSLSLPIVQEVVTISLV